MNVEKYCVTATQDEPLYYQGGRRNISLALLVGVNLLPLLAVLFLDWDVTALLVLYWSENLVLGFFTLLKMLSKSSLRGLGMGAFFTIHYGGFCAGHGLFLLLLLVGGDIDPTPEDPWPLFGVFIQLLLNVIREVLALAPTAWLFAFAALFISHGVSFVANFILGGERERVTLNELMKAPYGRIVILHVAILLGGLGIMALGQPMVMLLILVLLKTGLDVKLHLREHDKYRGTLPAT